MKIGGHPIDLMVDMGTEHSVVTKLVGPLSKKHTAIIGATGYQVCCPFLMTKQCNPGCHEVRHEFLYLPDCPVGLLGRDLLCKPRAQKTFDSDSTAALKLRGPEAKTLVMVAQEEEWWLMPLKEGLLKSLNSPLRFQVYRLKITLLVWPEMCPLVVVELKLGVTPLNQKQYFIP
jgi:hypothetical protein